MQRKLKLCISATNLSFGQAQIEAEINFEKAGSSIYFEHSKEIQRVVQTQRYMYREYDIIQREVRIVNGRDGSSTGSSSSGIITKQVDSPPSMRRSWWCLPE